MKKINLFTVVSAAVLSFSAFVNAATVQLTPVTVTGTGTYNNLGKINDGVFPNEGGQWQTNTTWWRGTAPAFTFDYGQQYLITDITLSVDNNDDYKVEYSTDGSAWSELFAINRSYGEIGWGMDTMSTISDHAEYIAAIDFTSVWAQFLRIKATGGDSYYSVGEFIAFADVSEVPLPAAVWLFGSALAGVYGFRRRAKAKLA